MSNIFDNALICYFPSLKTQKQLFLKLADLAAFETGLKSDDILMALLDREKLGSTAVGQGLAIPHAKMDGCKSPCIIAAVVGEPLIYNDDYDHKVDIIVLLLVPTAANSVHLKSMSEICRLLRNKETCSALRQAGSKEKIQDILSSAQ